MVAKNKTDHLKDIRILIIDNDRAIATMLEKLLTSRGATVNVVFDANEGLAAMKQDDVDVALIDINLGDSSMTGFDLIRAYKSQVQEATVRTIAITGYRFDDVEEELAEAGFDDYLAKPFKLADVVEKLSCA